MTTPIRFGLIGAGAIAGAHIEALQSLGDLAQCVGIHDLDSATAQAMAEKVGCPSFQNLEAFLDGAKPDAVILCTPPSTHAPLAMAMMERGISVLCEKPLSIRPENARAMLAAADAAGVVFTMASKFRYVEDVEAARKLIQDGIIGEVVLLENTFAARVDMKGRWNATPEVSGGGVLMDNGTHSADIVRYLLGPVREVQATEGNRFQKLDVEDTVHLFLRSEAGVMASIDLSWSINKQLDYYIGIYGTEGIIRIGWQESFYERPSNGGKHVFGSGYSKLSAFASQLKNFIGAMRGTEELRISPAEALDSVEVIAAAYRSLDANDWATVAPAHATH
ncbi:MAG: oxidoreductase [Planctomycetota bacterium]|nr:MAG: oxidoreductase [Planctomycetota bacterium]